MLPGVPAEAPTMRHSLTVPTNGSPKVALLQAMPGAVALRVTQVLFLPYITVDGPVRAQVPFSSAHFTPAIGAGAGAGTGAEAPTMRHSLKVP